jgi:hypothetical protein
VSDFWQRFFDFLEKHLPGLLAAFGIGYKVGAQKVEELSDEVEKLKLEKSLSDNKVKENEKNASKSSRDLVNDAISEGRGVSGRHE